MKKKLISAIYALLIIGVLSLFFFVITSEIDQYFFSYEQTIYKHEIDFLFQPQFTKHFKIKYVYKSGERGSVYYIKYDSLSNIAVIEAANYQDINVSYIQILSTDNIKVTQNKTYVTILNQPFPLIEQILNPKKSDFLAITFEKPFQIGNDIINNRYCYIRGNFNIVDFGNTQKASIVTFLKKYDNEILVLKQSNKMFFILQSPVNRDVGNASLLDIIKIPE
jgi:hypothetical protein